MRAPHWLEPDEAGFLTGVGFIHGPLGSLFPIFSLFITLGNSWLSQLPWEGLQEESHCAQSMKPWALSTPCCYEKGSLFNPWTDKTDIIFFKKILLLEKMHKPLIMFYIHIQKKKKMLSVVFMPCQLTKKVRLEKIFAISWEEILWAAGLLFHWILVKGTWRVSK